MSPAPSRSANLSPRSHSYPDPKQSRFGDPEITTQRSLHVLPEDRATQMRIAEFATRVVPLRKGTEALQTFAIVRLHLGRVKGVSSEFPPVGPRAEGRECLLQGGQRLPQHLVTVRRVRIEADVDAERIDRLWREPCPVSLDLTKLHRVDQALGWLALLVPPG